MKKLVYMELAEKDEILVDSSIRFLYIRKHRPDKKRKFYVVYLFRQPFSSEKISQLASGRVFVEKDFMPVDSNGEWVRYKDLKSSLTGRMKSF